jgi:hypothetical protein
MNIMSLTLHDRTQIVVITCIATGSCHPDVSKVSLYTNTYLSKSAYGINLTTPLGSGKNFRWKLVWGQNISAQVLQWHEKGREEVPVKPLVLSYNCMLNARG